MKRILAVLAATLVLVPALAVQPAAAARAKTIVGVAASDPQFSTLVRLVRSAGLVGALSGRAKLTVLAPTNAAFAKVPRRTLNALAGDRAALRRVLLYHVLRGAVPASAIVRLTSARTLAGPSIRISVRGRRVYVNDARVTKTDIRASNGIVHVIDRVLLPPS